MKIIYLHQYFATPEMAGGTRSYEMARRMVAAGHEVDMVTSYRSDDSRADGGWFTTNEAGIRVHWYPVPYSNHMRYRQRIKAFIDFARAARKKARSLQGDVVFATSTPLTIAMPAVLAARRLRSPLVFEVRDLWPEMPIAIGAMRNPLFRAAARWLERWAYRNSAAVVALSPGMKDGVVRAGFPKARVAVIPNSSDNHEFAHDPDAAAAFRAERSWLGNKPLLVYAGAFGKVNGVGYLIEIASRLLEMESDIRIMLVGDGAERESVIRQAQAAGVYDLNVCFEPKIAKRDVPAMLSAATMASCLFIDLPEMRPNSANKFFDALASGTPVLLNFGGWMHELVTTHCCGLAMWQAPVDVVASELECFLHDPERLQQSGQAARHLAEAAFGRDELADQLMRTLTAAVAGRPEQAAEIAPGSFDIAPFSNAPL